MANKKPDTIEDPDRPPITVEDVRDAGISVEAVPDDEAPVAPDVEQRDYWATMIEEARAIADLLGNALDGCDDTTLRDPGVRRLFKRRRSKALKAWRFSSWYR